MKKYIRLFASMTMLLLICLSGRTALAAGSAQIYMQMELPVEPGDVTVKASCEAVGGGKLTNGKIRIRYDAEKLKLEKSEAGAALGGFMHMINDCTQKEGVTKEEGEVVLVFASSEAKEVNGSMIGLTFSLKKDTKPDSTSLTVAVEELKQDDKNVAHQILGTRITEKAERTDISRATLAEIKNQPYTARQIRPDVKLTYNGALLTEGKDYVLSYKNNKKTGKAKIIISGIGDFTGSRQAYFYIVPAKAVLKSVSSPAKGKLQIRWKKGKQASGYEIQICKSKKFKKSVKKLLVKKPRQVSKLVKVKAGKTYYVRIRAYKTIDKKRCCGAFSKKRRIRVRK